MVSVSIRGDSRHGISEPSKQTQAFMYSGNTILVIYVDNILITGSSLSFCNSVASEIAQKVEIVNKGEVRSFLGFNVIRNYPQHAISISQPEYIDRLLAKYNMTNAKSASTPFERGTKLSLATPDNSLCNQKLYQELTGSLNHLAVFSRPDIAFAVSKLSKFNANPTMTHFKTALHVLRYLKSTRNYCIVYKRSPTVPITDIIGYFDADFANDEDDRKSYTGYVYYYKRRSSIVINSQTTHESLIINRRGIHGSLGRCTRSNCTETII